MTEEFDRSSATSYVRDLFSYVLDRSDATSEEVEYWTEFLLEHQDPADLLRRFGMSEENEGRSSVARERSRAQAFPPGHFYSPIADVVEIELDAERLFGDRIPKAVYLNVSQQKKTFRELAEHFRTIPFSQEKSDGLRYYYNNTSYAFGDAFGYWGMLRAKRPSRIIEIGSGFSSALALDAVDLLALDTTCTFIDPYPQLLHKVAAPVNGRHKVLAERVQSVDLVIVEDLRENDILFIDSSHVVKTGSDVHFEITEMLPRLQSGVIVHFHDVFDRFEYPRAWAVDSRLSWNELYFLQAFLMYNHAFEIIYFNDYFVKRQAEELHQLPMDVQHRIRLNPGGGLWLRKL